MESGRKTDWTSLPAQTVDKSTCQAEAKRHCRELKSPWTPNKKQRLWGIGIAIRFCISKQIYPVKQTSCHTTHVKLLWQPLTMGHTQHSRLQASEAFISPLALMHNRTSLFLLTSERRQSNHCLKFLQNLGQFDFHRIRERNLNWNFICTAGCSAGIIIAAAARREAWGRTSESKEWDFPQDAQLPCYHEEEDFDAPQTGPPGYSLNYCRTRHSDSTKPVDQIYFKNLKVSQKGLFGKPNYF